jgi:hypothetical protein
MACGPNEAQAPAWRIRSVPLRTRDGQARLAYRRLLSERPPTPRAADLDGRPVRHPGNDIGHGQRR